MKVISSSLWGTDTRYLIGAIENKKIAEDLFPDWEYRIYLGSNCKFKTDLLKNNINFIEIDENLKNYGMFWRYYAISENNICIFRDTDTRLLLREKKCIDEWLETDKKYHIIKDHPRHFDFPMLGGLWGIKGEMPKYMIDFMETYQKINEYLSDQIWLKQYVWPSIKNNVKIHQINDSTWFSLPKENPLIFIGQGYTETNIPIYPKE